MDVTSLTGFERILFFAHQFERASQKLAGAAVNVAVGGQESDAVRGLVEAVASARESLRAAVDSYIDERLRRALDEHMASQTKVD